MKQYDTYKDSGEKWIGVIPCHWNKRRMKFTFTERSEKNHPDELVLCATQSQGVIPQSMYNNRVVVVNKGFEKLKFVKVGDFVISLRSFQGGIEYAHYQGIISAAYTVLTPCVSIDRNYARWLFKSHSFIQLLKTCVTGIREGQNINYDILKNKYIPIPTKAEQKSIVAFLDEKTAEIDRIIQLKQFEIERTKEMIETMIYSSSPSESICFNSWEHSFSNDRILKSGRSLFEEVNIKGANNERFLAVTQDRGLIYKDTDEVNFVTAAQKETQKLVQPTQFVISLRSFEGGIEFSDKKGLVSPAYVIFKLRDQNNTPPMQTYYRFLFKSVPFVRRLNTISDSLRDGKSIKFADISNFLFPFPSETKQKEIMRLAKIYDIRKDVLFKEKQLFDEYKQRLISDVVTGKINVQNN